MTVNQSNSANFDTLTTPELAAALGQLRWSECEPLRELMLARIARTQPDIEPTTPTVVLLRMLGNPATRSVYDAASATPLTTSTRLPPGSRVKPRPTPKSASASSHSASAARHAAFTASTSSTEMAM